MALISLITPPAISSPSQATTNRLGSNFGSRIHCWNRSSDPSKPPQWSRNASMSASHSWRSCASLTGRTSIRSGMTGSSISSSAGRTISKK